MTIPRHPVKKERPEDERYKRMWKLYQQGHSLREIASIFNIHHRAVWEGFARRGLPRRECTQQQKSSNCQIFNGLRFFPRRDGYYRLRRYPKQHRYKYLHRLVWEFYKGPIPSGYTIHHKNSNKADNRIENLELLSRSEHAKLHWPTAKINARRLASLREQ